MDPDVKDAAVAYAFSARTLLAAARRAHERGDTVEFNRLFDEADEQLRRMIDAMPQEPRHD